MSFDRMSSILTMLTPLISSTGLSSIGKKSAWATPSRYLPGWPKSKANVPC